MNAEYHPDWCARNACTAYVEDGDELHRSEPMVIKTDDPTVDLFVYKTAGPDGATEYIEMARLDVPTEQSWHLSEPVLGTELVLPMSSAGAVVRAMAVLS
ncbi:hypothetical protein [Dactylosporangium roseum]